MGFSEEFYTHRHHAVLLIFPHDFLWIEISRKDTQQIDCGEKELYSKLSLVGVLDFAKDEECEADRERKLRTIDIDKELEREGWWWDGIRQNYIGQG